MMQSTFVLFLALAHVSGLAALWMSESTPFQWLASPAMFISSLLFGFVSLSASNVEQVTQSGTVVSTTEPGVGVYAFGLGTIAFVLTLVMLLNWIPTPSQRRFAS